MKILFVSSFLLFRETRFGGAKRLYYFARGLRKRHDLSLIAFDSCGEMDDFNRANGAAEFTRCLPIAVEQRRRSLLDLFRVPFAAPVRRAIARRAGEVRRFLGAGGFDATLLAFPAALCMLERQWHPILGANSTYLEDDLFIETIRTRRNAAPDPARRIWHQHRYRQAVTLYRNRLATVQKFVAISREEQDIIRTHFPWMRVSVLKYGIPLEEYPLLPEPVNKRALGFIGNFDHRPNREAIDRFLAETYPAIREKMPGISLCIAGRNIPADLRRRHAGDSSLLWKENIENLRDFYEGISFFVNPIVSGRGLRTKLVEAAAFGRPVISSRLGAEGLEELRIDIAETGEEYVRAITSCIGNDDKYREITRHNRKVVEEQLNISASTGRLLTILNTLPVP